MAEKRRGLGRGLGALIPNNTTPVVTASDVAEKEAEKGSGDSQTSAGGTSRRILGKTPEDSQRKAGAAEKSAPKKEPSATTKRTEQQENRISSSQRVRIRNLRNLLLRLGNLLVHRNRKRFLRLRCLVLKPLP